MKPIITILSCLLLLQAKAQEKKYTQNLLTATILSPGISYEIAAGNKFTVKLKAVVFPGFRYSQTLLLNGRSHFSFVPTAVLSADGRYYYNFQQRLKKEKNINRNSANYIGLTGSYGSSIETFHAEDGTTVRTITQLYDIGFVWGMQRNYDNRFSLDLNVGPSILRPLVDGGFGITANLTLGIWLGKRSS
jgi:hypothetical protein